MKYHNISLSLNQISSKLKYNKSINRFNSDEMPYNLNDFSFMQYKLSSICSWAYLSTNTIDFIKFTHYRRFDSNYELFPIVLLKIHL